MNDDLKQIQGIKRAYDSNPAATNAGYQPVAKKKKGEFPAPSEVILTFTVSQGVPVVGTTLRELIHTTSKSSEPTIIDDRSRNCPYLDTINRWVQPMRSFTRSKIDSCVL